MGALHAGHARLIEQAVRETDCAVVSIFVNPIQFNDPRDYGQYPRTLVEDAALCGRLGAPIVFAPAGEEMYPRPQQSFVEVQGVTEFLCGQFRPGHFRGVATVVLKLFQIVQPDVAYFGEKDAQQLAVIRRMVSDLNVPLRIVEVATVREHDGLALSSRNRLLSGEERRLAPALYQVLRQAQDRIAAGACDAAAVRREAVAALDERRIRVEYLEIVDPESMQPLERIDAPVRVAAAIWLGVTRLIDNLLCTPPAFEP
jgi:pantoate--beta-alanine ligase